jgi:hypothetical protein
MVNGLQRKKSVVVKLSDEGCVEPATAKGGLCALEAFARRTGLWSLCDRHLAPRRDARQGFTTTAAVSALMHGLLSGGRGFAATEPMRGDAPLVRLMGLGRAPSAETVEEVVKYLAQHADGHEGLMRTMGLQCEALIGREKRASLMNADGFVPVWADGSLLEVEGGKFEAKKFIDGKWGQVVAAAFVGPYLVASNFAAQGEGELSLSRGFLGGELKSLLERTGLADKSLVLLDSLYGDGPTFDLLERELASVPYVVGVNKLVEAHNQMADLPESHWRDTKANPKRAWAESAVCTLWLQCADWTTKRLCVCRRWRTEGEFVHHYSAVATSLRRTDRRLREKIVREKLCCFEEAVWRLYDEKQAMENNWKSLLIDLGLHHPPSSSVRANAVFFAVAGLAYNLGVGFGRLALEGPARHMRLWRLRREVIDMAARVTTHARQVVIHLLDARETLVTQMRRAMGRVALL